MSQNAERAVFRAVEIPVVRCPTCDAAYVLRLPLFIMGGEPEWIYQPDCRHKPQNYSVEPDDMEFARLAVARIESAE